MTRSIHLIGDSHLNSIHDSLFDLIKLQSIGKNIIKASPEECYKLLYDKDTDTEYHFHYKPGRLAYKIDYSNLKFSENIKRGDKVILYLGDCDVRLHLTRFHNAIEVVESYVLNTVEHFTENEIFFLTPVPPLDEMQGSSIVNKKTLEWVNNRTTPEERGLEYNLFVDNLYAMCKKLSLPEPIDIRFGSKFLSSDYRRSDLLHVSIDHGKKIAQEIMKRSELYN
jgi:hypothetical protein